MYWNPDEYSEYNENSGEIDYSHPSYYGQTHPETPHSAQSVQRLDSYPDYANGPTIINSYDTAQMEEYRSPSNMEGYTIDVGAEQREAAKRGSAERGKKRKGVAGLGGIAATIGALLLKFKTLLVLLFDIKWLAFFAKFGLAGITAVVSIAAYSLLFGWPFAVGLVALLFIHEMGHAVVMKLKGIPVGGMVFIPMLGAAVFMRRLPGNAKDEAEVGIAGPIAGGLASLVCLLFALSSRGSPGVWAPLAYFGFFINLFNLIPIIPFDGGRVLSALDRRVWLLGFFALVAIQIWQWLTGNFSIWLLIFIVMAATEFWARRRTKDTPEAQAYYAVPVGERIIIGLAYFGLIAVLILGMTVAHGMMGIPQ